MATGKTYAQISPGKLVAGQPEVVYVAEASSQNFFRGAPVVRTSGYVNEMAANGILLYGFAAEDARSGAADGTYTTPIYKAGFGKNFVGSLNATLTQAMIGSVATLVESASSWYLETATSVSSVAQVTIEGVAEGFAIGDTKPLVYFSVIQSMIEES